MAPDEQVAPLQGTAETGAIAEGEKLMPESGAN